MNGKQSVLERLHKSSISAKDIANQYWCERQMDLNYTNPAKPTKAMDKGSSIHETLQKEVYVELKITPVSFADRMYKTAYEGINTLNTLYTTGVARELNVYDSINGYRLLGKIDELRMKDGRVVVVENKTAKASSNFSNEYIKPHVVQLMLYRRMLENMNKWAFDYDDLNNWYRMTMMKLTPEYQKGLKELGIKDELTSIPAIYTKMFEMVARMELSSDLILHYVDREKGTMIKEIEIKYDKTLIESEIIDSMRFWNGERESKPVPEKEKWKCNICRHFGNACMVWYKK